VTDVTAMLWKTQPIPTNRLKAERMKLLAAGIVERVCT
jgi:hypothetical protein